MDLSTKQELMMMPSRCSPKNGNRNFIMEETHEETDIIGNNNMFNSFKTDTNINHDHEPSSLFQGNCKKGTELEVDNSLFSYSSFKKAMDLRCQNVVEEIKKTIFEDAEYFAENYCYKLLPITFDQVDETIIQTEHNYSLSSPNSESEAEDCSRTMDYSQIKEKNYKKRKTKVGSPESDISGDEKLEVDVSSMFHQEVDFPTEFEHQNCSENSGPVQPLDLSAPPVVQLEKTDPCPREHRDSIFENDDVAQPDSDKENVNSELNGIRVTITRPDEKENYQPCDLFLNDVARLVPWLIGKDCCEVDILDRTCDRHEELRAHRLYYVISESTWRLFQKSNERVILTNDQSLGQPLTKADKNEKPSYLIFDQFSLAKCLAEYCQEIGGCFEYTCVEEEKEEEQLKEKFPEEEAKESPKAVEEVQEGKEIEESISEPESERMQEETVEEEKENVKKEEEESQKEEQKVSDLIIPDLSETEIEKKDEKDDEVISENHQDVEEESKTTSAPIPEEKIPSNVKKKVPMKKKKRKSSKVFGGKRKKPDRTGKKSKNESKESPIQPQPNNSQITTRSKSTSLPETSQVSDKSVIRRGRKKPEPSTLPEEPPNKRINLVAQPEDLRRRITRSGKALENKPTEEKKKKKKSETGEKKEGEIMSRLRKRAVQRRKKEEKTSGRMKFCLRTRSKKR